MKNKNKAKQPPQKKTQIKKTIQNQNQTARTNQNKQLQCYSEKGWGWVLPHHCGITFHYSSFESLFLNAEIKAVVMRNVDRTEVIRQKTCFIVQVTSLWYFVHDQRENIYTITQLELG